MLCLHGTPLPHGRGWDVGQDDILRTDCQSVQLGAARPALFLPQLD